MASTSIKNATLRVEQTKQNMRNAELGTPIVRSVSAGTRKEKEKFSSIKAQALAEQAEARRLGQSIY